MPTPYGTRGGLAFGAEELRVLRRALALALQPRPASAEDVKDCLRLAESVDEAVREGARLRAFLLADLARYRAALPGTATGYCGLLEEALGAGHLPTPDDLAALRTLRGTPTVAALLDRCRVLAERDVCARPAPYTAAAVIPASRTRLSALAGGRAGTEESSGQPPRRPDRKPAEKPDEKPERPAPRPEPQTPRPARPIPTPGEVFPPKRKPGPPERHPQQLAVG